MRNRFAVGRFSAVAEVPPVKQRVIVRVGAVGSEAERFAHFALHRRPVDAQFWRAIGGNRAVHHPHVHPQFPAIAATGHGRDRHPPAAIMERFAHLQRVVARLALLKFTARLRRHVEQQRAVAAHRTPRFEPPAQHDFIPNHPVPDAHPVVAPGVFANLQRAHADAGLAVVVRLHAIGASAGDRSHRRIRNPREIVLEIDVEVPVRGVVAHVVVWIAVFIVLTDADRGVALRRHPGIGVKQSKVVADLVLDRVVAETAVEPKPDRADPRLAGPAVENRVEANNVQVVVAIVVFRVERLGGIAA